MTATQGHYRSEVARFDDASDDLELLGFLHDVADAAADTLDETSDWSPADGHEGQYAADVVVDDVVVDMLESRGFAVLSEESGASDWLPGSGQLLVVVDPVDGSTNASKDLPWYATSLCIVDRDGPRVALVAEQSGSETRYSAIRGAGARCDGIPVRGSGVREAGRAVVGVNGVPPARNGWWQVRTMGAASLDISLVARGGLDAYVDFHGHGVWDYLAAYLVCTEAGVQVADAEGRDLVVLDPDARRRPVAAATPALLQQVLGVARGI